MVWYRIDCKDHHRGRGTNFTQTIYVNEKNTICALDKYQHMGNVSHDGVPNIRKLSPQEAETLESYIVRELKRDIRKARKKGVRFRDEAPLFKAQTSLAPLRSLGAHNCAHMLSMLLTNGFF